MPVSVICPIKKKPYLAPDNAAGQRLCCPHCQARYVGSHPSEAQFPVAKFAPPLQGPEAPLALTPHTLATPSVPVAGAGGRNRRLPAWIVGAAVVVLAIGIAGALAARSWLGAEEGAGTPVALAQAPKTPPEDRGPREEAGGKEAAQPAPAPEPRDLPKQVSPAPEPKPLPSPFDDNETLVLRFHVHSVARLLEHVQFLTESANRGAMYDQFLQAIPAAFGQQKMPDIDLNKPLGAYVQLRPEAKGFNTLIMVPIGDKAKFTRSMNLPDAPHPDGNYYFTLAPDGPKSSLRLAHGYAYVSVAEPHPKADADLLKPAQVFAAEDATVSAVFRIDRLADGVGSLAKFKESTDAMRNALVLNKTPVQRAFLEKCFDRVLDLRADLLKGSKEASLRLRMNHAAKKLTLELRLDPVNKSSLAESIAAVGAMTSLFGEFADGDAAFRLLLHAKLSDELRALWAPLAREITQMVLLDDSDPAALKEFKGIMEALHPTIEAGELDFGAVMRGKEGKLAATLVGIKAPSSHALEKVLKDKVAQLPDRKDREVYQWDVERVGDVRVHRLDVRGLIPAPLAQVYGDNPYYLAFRKDAVLAATGPEGKASLQSAIRARPKQAPPLLLEVNVKNLVEILPDDGRERIVARKHFTDQHTGQVKLSLNGGDALRLRLELDLSLVAFVMELAPPIQLGPNP